MSATVASPVPLQSLQPATGSVVTFVGTLLVFWVMYSLTAHIAARYVLGDVPVKRAFLVGPAPAIASLLLQSYGPAVSIAATLAVDYFAIQAVYRLRYGRTALVAVVHYTVTILLGIMLFNLLALLSTAPG